MGGLKVLLSGAARLDDVDAMREAMRDATEQLSGHITTLRSLIAELRPPVLDQLGLAPALASLAQRTAAANGLEIRTDIRLPEDRRFDAELETTVYRVVQESLTNVVKHAQAASVDLSVQCNGDTIELTVNDDGIGFDLEEAAIAGFGLAGMRERVELADGDLRVLPRADSGTLVRARLPI
jgi:signal transduction histidine kinase